MKENDEKSTALLIYWASKAIKRNRKKLKELHKLEYCENLQKSTSLSERMSAYYQRLFLILFPEYLNYGFFRFTCAILIYASIPIALFLYILLTLIELRS